ncbi:MAG: YlxR family protein [Propionibacteriaceae bacterium]|jgi:predicted RNA-binding protein YlxR (DUF448 family)|nr:YlxR family protein [Propionibacteriaceae bacterium]
MTDRSAGGTPPERSCVGCRRKGTRDELARYVAVAGVLTRDDRKRLPGRGAWVHDDPRCLELALKRRAFERAGIIARVPRANDAMRIPRAGLPLT